MFEGLNPVRLDLLREICSVGAGHAATALSQLIGGRVDLAVPRVVFAEVEQVPRIAGGGESAVAGLYFTIRGDAGGIFLMIFPEESARRMVRLVCRGGGAPDLDEPMSVSAMREIGNILSSAFLSAISDLSGLTLTPSVPGYARDLAGAILDRARSDLSSTADVALVVETVLRETGDDIRGHLFLLPDSRFLDVILGAVQRPRPRQGG